MLKSLNERIFTRASVPRMFGAGLHWEGTEFYEKQTFDNTPSEQAKLILGESDRS